MAYGLIFAERRILFMLIFPMKARTFAFLMFFLAFYYNMQSAGSGVPTSPTSGRSDRFDLPHALPGASTASTRRSVGASSVAGSRS